MNGKKSIKLLRSKSVVTSLQQGLPRMIYEGKNPGRQTDATLSYVYNNTLAP